MGQTNYAAAKAGVQAMAVAWAKELARYGIRAAVGRSRDSSIQKWSWAMKEEARNKLTSGIPLAPHGRTGRDRARPWSSYSENDYVSGRCFDIDGALAIVGSA